MNTSEQINELATALAKAQGEMKAIKRNATAKIPMKSGGSYSFDYSTLDNVIDCTRKPLADNGLAIVQAPSFTDSGLSLVTRIMHSSGQWIECDLSMQTNSNDIKILGGVITYLRRYSFTAMVGVASDEDKDAPEAQVSPAKSKREPKAQPQQQSQQSQAQAVKFIAFYAKAKEDCGLEPEAARLICKELGISFDPSKMKSIIDTLCKETEKPSTWPSLIVAANKSTGDYYNRSEKLMDNKFHVKGSVEKLHPDIAWTSKPGNPNEWAEALALAIEYAEANQQDPTAQADIDEAFPRQDAKLFDDSETREHPEAANALVEG